MLSASKPGEELDVEIVGGALVVRSVEGVTFPLFRFALIAGESARAPSISLSLSAIRLFGQDADLEVLTRNGPNESLDGTPFKG